MGKEPQSCLVDSRLKSSRLVDLWSFSILLSYFSAAAAGFFSGHMHCETSVPLSAALSLFRSNIHPQTFCFSRALALCSSTCAGLAQSLTGEVSAAQNQKFPCTFVAGGLLNHLTSELVGRPGFEPGQSASKALDLPLVDRPVSLAQFKPTNHSANIVWVEQSLATHT